jgi:hypothetical protein
VSTPSTNFTVALPVGSTVPAPVTITPAAVGGGTFTPSTVALTTASPSATFTYTPASTGTKTISTTNDGALTNPASLSYNSTGATATSYTLTGPSAGIVSIASTNFTVAIPGGSILPAPVTITPHDAGAGGTFTPTTVNLSTGTPSATFTYTPASTGAKTISVTNSSTLTNPANLTYTVSGTVATSYTLSGPSSGGTGLASTNFTVAIPGGTTLGSPVTITPSSGGGGGTFTPSSVILSTGSPSATFIYTPASIGTKTISTTNSGALTDPGSLSYLSLAFLDNFTGSSVLGSHIADTGQGWNDNGLSVLALVGGGFVSVATSAGAAGYYAQFTPVSADQEASMTIAKGSISGSPEIGLWLRANLGGGTPTGYMLRFAQGSGFQFYQVTAGPTYIQIGASVAGSINDGDVLRATVAGTGATVTLTLYVNGTSVATANDTTGSRLTANGKIGLYIYDPAGSSGASNYKINSVTSP